MKAASAARGRGIADPLRPRCRAVGTAASAAVAWPPERLWIEFYPRPHVKPEERRPRGLLKGRAHREGTPGLLAGIDPVARPLTRPRGRGLGRMRTLASERQRGSGGSKRPARPTPHARRVAWAGSEQDKVRCPARGHTQGPPGSAPQLPSTDGSKGAGGGRAGLCSRHPCDTEQFFIHFLASASSLFVPKITITFLALSSPK